MDRFAVTIHRIEEITFELDAADSAGAEARYLADGDETAAKTLDTRVVSVEAA